jgi:hypothetical protein
MTIWISLKEFFLRSRSINPKSVLRNKYLIKNDINNWKTQYNRWNLFNQFWTSLNWASKSFKYNPLIKRDLFDRATLSNLMDVLSDIK